MRGGVKWQVVLFFFFSGRAGFSVFSFGVSARLVDGGLGCEVQCASTRRVAVYWCAPVEIAGAVRSCVCTAVWWAFGWFYVLVVEYFCRCRDVLYDLLCLKNRDHVFREVRALFSWIKPILFKRKSAPMLGTCCRHAGSLEKYRSKYLWMLMSKITLSSAPRIERCEPFSPHLVLCGN